MEVTKLGAPVVWLEVAGRDLEALRQFHRSRKLARAESRRGASLHGLA
jgi:hypothetical protein